MEKTKVIGQTKDAGFEIGVRKTFPVSVEQAWNFLFSDQGLAIWLGGINPNEFDINQGYKTAEGTAGKLTIFKPYSHTRLTWRRKDWNNTSTLQLRVINAKGKAPLSFHQEKLLNNNQRDEMKAHWDAVITQIGSYLK
ncbi:SRPBCC domain-containing protein [Mucilaginibacter sp. NFX135]|uniref:SRPBCC domain-containing protein n=1 Tax=Mucilaginibacter sp. NFX135 TaxID=3402687 RepID=UPI003AFA287A